MTPDKGQIAQLKRLVQEDGWDILTGVVLAGYLEKINVPITGNNEFETLRDLHTQQGKEEGLKDFFDYVEKMGFE